MFSVAAYFQNGDFGGADTLLNAVPDQHLTVNGKDIRTIDGLTNLLGAGVTTVAATRNYASVQSPSMRTLANQDVGFFNGSASFATDDAFQTQEFAPRGLDVDESINFLVNSDDAGAQDHFAAIWLGDGPVQPVKGKMFTVRCTATIAQVNGVWVNGGLTFTQKLPVTNYQVVGMKVVSATGLLGRLIFPGGRFRPGVPVATNAAVNDWQRFRYGAWGVWGEFNINQPPQLEMFAGAAAVQTVFLDLIQK